jgi:hypothetical protein
MTETIKVEIKGAMTKAVIDDLIEKLKERSAGFVRISAPSVPDPESLALVVYGGSFQVLRKLSPNDPGYIVTSSSSLETCLSQASQSLGYQILLKLHGPNTAD